MRMGKHTYIHLDWTILVSVTFTSLSVCKLWPRCLSEPSQVITHASMGNAKFGQEGRVMGEGEREVWGWRSGLWFALNGLDKQGGEKQNKLKVCGVPALKIALIASIFWFRGIPSVPTGCMGIFFTLLYKCSRLNAKMWECFCCSTWWGCSDQTSQEG